MCNPIVTHHIVVLYTYLGKAQPRIECSHLHNHPQLVEIQTPIGSQNLTASENGVQNPNISDSSNKLHL